MIRLFILFFILIPISFANNSIVCPSISEIKNKQFNGWLPLYIDGEELASQNDINLFIEKIKYFEAAKWSWSYLESGHCFYGGDAVTKKIILAHNTSRPTENINWRWMTPDRLAVCYSSNSEACQFLN